MAEDGEVLVRRRWTRWLGIVALLLGLVILGLWLARKPIAQGRVDGFLASAGVRARYTISDLGLGRQRLTNVVIGDPAQPDLVADWLETRIGWGLNGPSLTEVRGGHVRVRARWVDGKLSVGSIDRLLPKGKAGKPFALPALALDVADLRARVETPWGVVGAKLAGKGRLDNGFDGRLAVTATRLGDDCGAIGPGAVVRVTTEPGLVRLDGSARALGVACADVTAAYTQLSGRGEIKLGKVLNWSLRADATAQAPRHALARASRLVGRVDLAGDDALSGDVSLTANGVVAADGTARAVTADGKVVRVGRALTFTGGVDGTGIALRLPLPAIAGFAATPLEPLVGQLRRATANALDAFDLQATVGASTVAGLWIGADGVSLRAASGARAELVRDDREVALGWRAPGRLLVDGTLTISGGGFPEMRATLDQAVAGRPIKGRATVADMRAPGALLALGPMSFTVAPGRSVRLRTMATVSGPLGDGRVEQLVLPIDARWQGGALTLGGGCVPVSWAGIAVSGLRLDPGALRLCPEGEALVHYDGGRLTGGARIAAARLTGRLGATPLTLAVADARVRVANRGLALRQVEARLGTPARLTRLSVGSLEGRLNAGVLAGRFAEAGGQIGNVPLVLTQANGAWRFAGGALAVDGALTVSDAAAPARFQPMAARGVTLRLAKGAITAVGVLHEPVTGTKVADTAIRHDLAAGTGTADLTVPSLSFVKGFQPEQLTRLTFGVIAGVRGTVSGAGHLAWTPAGVTSTGVFRTDGTDLAAAFGPVTGLAGEIRFTDLLALQSAPGQRVTVKSINPGVPVTDGVITFQTLPGTRVSVEGGHWPFAGGTLALDPTLLDFSATAQRRMTFRVTGAAADRFLQSFDLKNLDATGIFDGVLPMVFDAGGGRIEDGRLTVRPGGGTIAYVGDIGRENLGFWGNFAFDTLKSLRYRSLGIVMNGPLAGELVTEVRFAGISQGTGAKSNFIVRRLQRLPVVFNIRIRAPFRGLLDATASFYDPRRLIERNLPELIERERKPIQPPVSETMP